MMAESTIITRKKSLYLAKKERIIFFSKVRQLKKSFKEFNLLSSQIFLKIKNGQYCFFFKTP
jgi:hypothetical protein